MACLSGGNSGIGAALCKQLATEDGCFVFLGSRSVERGEKALSEMGAGVEAKVTVVQCDISSPESVAAAAATVKAKLEAPLFALVNNAGVGLAHGVSADEQIATNLYGTKCMTDAFLPLLDSESGRVVTVSSGAGPMWLEKQDEATKALMTKPDVTWDELDKYVKDNRNEDLFYAYGISKCTLSAWSVAMANSHPKLSFSSITPGFIETSITKGMGASKPPEEGTVSIRHCLFQKLEGNGYFYGSDAIRSPFWPVRSPGEPPFTGVYPWSK